MKIKSFLIASLAAFSLTAGAQSLSPNTKWHWDKGTIVVETPERPAGQQNVLGLRAPKLQTVRVGFVGLGMRGPWAVMRFCHIPGVEIVALCDYEEERAEKSQEFLRKQGLKRCHLQRGKGLRGTVQAPRHRPGLHRCRLEPPFPSGSVCHGKRQAYCHRGT